MTSPAEQSTPPSSSDDQRRHVLNFFLEQQADDPDFLQNLIARIAQDEWEHLPDAERDAITIAQQLLQPGDVAERERATRATLLAHYIMHEMDLTQELEAGLREIMPPDHPLPAA